MIERLDAALSGRYRVERELGQGGMATVYLAEDVRHHRHVALKVLRPELAAVVGGERFLSEIETTANLQHPHILPLFDSGEADSFLFYVMPYVEGESLRERLDRERQLPVDEAVRIAEKVAGALQTAHEQGVIHRDIKPANILLSRGEPVVSDFGIALAVSEAGGGRITETGLSLGTPHYMSPEQAAGERTLDKRSDVYALGCVLYEMLTGEPPYGGPTSQAVLAKILTEEPRRVRELRRTVPANVEAALARALEKLPADRFESAAAFVAALRDGSFRHAPEVAPVPRARRSSAAEGEGPRLSPARPVPMLALGVAAVLASGVAAWGWLRPAPRAPELPVGRFTVLVPDGLADPGGKRVVVSPDGTHIAYLGVGEGGRQLFVRSAADPTPRSLAGTAGAQHPFFSPDGEWIGFVTSDGIRKVPTAGGPVVTVARTTASGSHWSSEGTIVFQGSDGLYRVPAVGGVPEMILEADSGSLRWPELLPGGEAVVFTAHHAGPEDAAVRLLELGSGEVRTLVAPGNQAHYVPAGYLVYGHAPSQSAFAVPFDLRRLEVTGEPVPVVENVGVYTGSALQLHVSGNGTAVYTGGRTEGRLVVVDREGNEDPLPLPPGDFGDPRFSPDGTRILYETGGDVWVYDVVLGTNTRITFEGTNRYPFWSPDGRYAVFSSSRDGSDADDGFRKPVDGSGPAEALFRLEHFNYPQAWSPDGRYLLYRENHPERSRDLRVLTVGPDGEVSTAPYVTGVWDEYAAALSPDGRWVAYVSDESGDAEIYVRAFPEPTGRWQVSQGGGEEPRWSPDGRTIYYRNESGFMAASVRADPGFAVLGREPVFRGQGYARYWLHAQYDVHPEGDRFVVVKRESGAPGSDQFTVVVNWLRELEERMGR